MECGRGVYTACERPPRRGSEHRRTRVSPVPAGQLTATWHLADDKPAAQITLHFTATQAGQFSLGYHGPMANPPSEMEFLLLPFLVQGRRLPAEENAVLDARTPTPMTMVQWQKWSIALLAESWESFGWLADRLDSRYALAIRNEAGQAQPIIYSPVLGLAGSAVEAGGSVENRLWLWASRRRGTRLMNASCKRCSGCATIGVRYTGRSPTRS